MYPALLPFLLLEPMTLEMSKFLLSFSISIHLLILPIYSHSPLASTVIVISVSGNDCGFNNMNMFSVAKHKARILWHFSDCESMSIIDTSILVSALSVII